MHLRQIHGVPIIVVNSDAEPSRSHFAFLKSPSSYSEPKSFALDGLMILRSPMVASPLWQNVRWDDVDRDRDVLIVIAIVRFHQHFTLDGDF
jgi:hypothetical protein